jgi:Ca2+/Na+ antiporter
LAAQASSRSLNIHDVDEDRADEALAPDDSSRLTIDSPSITSASRPPAPLNRVNTHGNVHVYEYETERPEEAEVDDNEEEEELRSHQLTTLSPSSNGGVSLDDDLASPSPSDDMTPLREIEEPPSLFSKVLDVVTAPLNFLFDHTCVSCEWDNPHKAQWYPLTFAVSFVWVSIFSFLISVIVGRFVERSGVSQSFFGLVLVALGAEIPDTIQSVTVASRGYGSMAVANSCGSQITNILVGLGLPWFFADLNADSTGGEYVKVSDHANLQVAAFFQFGNISLFVAMLLLAAVVQNTPKAQLTRKKGYIFLASYLVCMGGYAIYIFA